MDRINEKALKEFKEELDADYYSEPGYSKMIAYFKAKGPPKESEKKKGIDG